MCLSAIKQACNEPILAGIVDLYLAKVNFFTQFHKKNIENVLRKTLSSQHIHELFQFCFLLLSRHSTKFIF